MLQVTVKLMFNISLGLIFYLILISCMVVVMVFSFIESLSPCRNLWLQRPPPVTSPPTFHSHLQNKVPFKDYAQPSLPSVIPAKMRFRTAAKESRQGTQRNQHILLQDFVKSMMHLNQTVEEMTSVHLKKKNTFAGALHKHKALRVYSHAPVVAL